MTCGIYKIVNKINGKIYVGQSVDIERRLKAHKKLSKTKDGHLYKAIRKYGLDNFEFSVIVECDECMLDEFEIGIIQLYDTTNSNKGYNNMTGGVSQGRHSEETKQKMSKTRKCNKNSIKKYIYQNQTFTGLQALADFLKLNYFTLANRIHKKQIDVTIIKE